MPDERAFWGGRVTRVGVGEWLGDEAVGGRVEGRRAEAERRSTGELSASSPLPPSGVRVTKRPQEGTLRRKGLYEASSGVARVKAALASESNSNLGSEVRGDSCRLTRGGLDPCTRHDCERRAACDAFSLERGLDDACCCCCDAWTRAAAWARASIVISEDEWAAWRVDNGWDGAQNDALRPFSAARLTNSASATVIM